jgi:hypothetical protein
MKVDAFCFTVFESDKSNTEIANFDGVCDYTFLYPVYFLLFEFTHITALSPWVTVGKNFCC